MDGERGSIETVQNLQIPAGNGQAIPLAAVATLRYDLEQTTVMRRSRMPTITLKADIVGSLQPATVATQLEPSVEAFRQKLPVGYNIEVAGTVE